MRGHSWQPPWLLPPATSASPFPLPPDARSIFFFCLPNYAPVPQGVRNSFYSRCSPTVWQSLRLNTQNWREIFGAVTAKEARRSTRSWIISGLDSLHSTLQGSLQDHQESYFCSHTVFFHVKHQHSREENLHAHNIQLVIVTENTICAVLGMPDLLAL